MQTSSKQTFKYMSENIKHNRRLFLILSFLMGIGLIMASGCISATSHFKSVSNMRDIFAGIAVVGAIIFLSSTIVYIVSAPIQMFSYNLIRSKTDMIYALPIKKDKRFLADFFGGLISVIIPYVLFGIVASLIVTFSTDWGSLSIPDAGINRTIFSTFLSGLAIITMIYSIVSLVCQFTGTIIDAITFTVLIIAEIPAGILAVSSLVNQYSDYMTVYAYPAAFYGTNPVGLLIYTVSKLSGIIGDDATFSDSIMFPKWSLVLVIIISIIVIFALAYIIQKFRKAEDTGKSVTCEPIFHIQMAIIAILFVMFGFLINGISVAIISCIFFAAIIYVFVKRGKFKSKTIIMSVVELCIAGAITASFAGALESTDSFKCGEKIPSSSSVKSIDVSLVDESSRSINVTFDEPDKVKKITDLSKKALDFSNQLIKDENLEITSNNITFLFNLKSGFRKNRVYSASHITDSKEVYDYIYQTEEYKNAVAESAKEAIKENESFYHDYQTNKENYQNYLCFGDGVLTSQDTFDLSKDVTAELETQFYRAALEDVENRTLEDIYQNDIYVTVNNFVVLTCDENMIDVLKKYVDMSIKTSDILKDETFTIIDPADYYFSNYEYLSDGYYSEDSEYEYNGNEYYGYSSDETIGSVDFHIKDAATFKKDKQEYISKHGNYKTNYYYYINVSENADRKDGLKFNSSNELSKNLYKFYCSKDDRAVIDDKNDEYYVMILENNYTFVFVPKNAETEALYKSF